MTTQTHDNTNLSHLLRLIILPTYYNNIITGIKGIRIYFSYFDIIYDINLMYFDKSYINISSKCILNGNKYKCNIFFLQCKNEKMFLSEKVFIFLDYE